MLIKKTPGGKTDKPGALPWWRSVQRWATALAITAGSMPGANAQVREMPAKADQALQQAREQLLTLRALRESSEREIMEAKKPQPKIVVAPTLLATPASLINLDIRIDSAGPVPTGSSLEIFGLPPFVTMSAGQALTNRSWALPLESLSNLKMHVPADAFGRLALDLRLVTESYVVVAFASTELIIEDLATTAGALIEPRELVKTKTSEQSPGSDPTKTASEKQKSLIAGLPEREKPKLFLEQQDMPISPITTQGRPDNQSRQTITSDVETSELHVAKDSRITQALRAHEVNMPARQPQERVPVNGILRSDPPYDSQQMLEADAITETVPDAQPLAKPKAAGRADQIAQINRGESREEFASNQTIPVAELDKKKPKTFLIEPQASAAKREQAERLLNRGDLALAHGNIVVAREYYLRAAYLDVAGAALRLAETHDPHEIERLRVLGVTANPEEARRWYQRASALGASEAQARLRRLETR